MNEKDFRNFMKKQHRSQGTMDSCVDFTRVFEEYLNVYCNNIPVNEAQPEHLDTFLDWGKKEIGSMNSYLWAISRYYEFASNDKMHRYANKLRGQAIAKKRPKYPNLLLKEIQGVETEYIEALETVGISNIKQLLKAGASPESRSALSEKTKIHLSEITELVQISDLCRISDIKGVRVRLLFDTGFDTIEMIADQDPEDMRAQINMIIENKSLSSKNPTLAETKFWVYQARNLPKLVLY